MNPFYKLNNLLWGKRQTDKIVQVTEDDKCPMPLSKKEQQEVDFIRWVGTVALFCVLVVVIANTIEGSGLGWKFKVGLIVGIWAFCRFAIFMGKPR